MCIHEKSTPRTNSLNGQFAKPCFGGSYALQANKDNGFCSVEIRSVMGGSNASRLSMCWVNSPRWTSTPALESDSWMAARCCRSYYATAPCTKEVGTPSPRSEDPYSRESCGTVNPSNLPAVQSTTGIRRHLFRVRHAEISCSGPAGRTRSDFS